jgi:anion-transporting  ArsA/GET3 family ATPase
MISSLNSAKVIICVGSGGVGKTTVASAIAFQAAIEGKKVIVLTVDPAKRLKTTMGLSDDEDMVQVKHPSFKGELWASVIDNKKTFDDFVRRAAAKGGGNVERILKNKLYIQLSTTLSGSQEFTAVEKLYSVYESQKFDLIVLDTPPAQHAMDFLVAPQKLSDLFNDNIAKWFREPGTKGVGIFTRIVQTGTKQVMKALENLTGSEFISELAEFFRDVEKWQTRLEERTSAVHRLLVGEQSHFVLVTSFDESKLQEAERFSKEIRKGGYRLSAVIINRAYPSGIGTGLDLQFSAKGGTDLERTYIKTQDYYRQRDGIFEKFFIRMGHEGQVLRLPELESDVSDLIGVEEMARELKT